MSTRRPKVPQARPAAAGGGSSADGGAQPVRRRTAADPDTISATKPVGGTPVKTAAKTAAKTAVKPAVKQAAKTAVKPAVKPAAKTPAKTAAKPAAATADDLRPVPAKAFSGRLLVLAMVTAVVTVLLAPSVSTYLHQRSNISALEADIAAQKQAATDLESQLDRWADPNYIKQQARERIFLVMPGETRYLVKGEHGVENAEQQAQEQEADLQWVDALWDSVTRSAAAP